jgi:hypothetical protein
VTGAAALAALALAAPAPTAEPTAPLTVTFRATDGAALYRWDFGDGTAGEGAVVEHVYAEPGRYRATLTTEVGEASVEAVAYRVSFDAPSRARYGTLGRFSGSIWPAVPRARVEVIGPGGTIVRGKTRANGGFVLHARIRGIGPFRARIATLLSGEALVRVRPAIDAQLVGSGLVGDWLRVVASVRPAGAGTLTATVWRNGKRTYSGPAGGKLRLRTGRPASFRVRLEVTPAAGYSATLRTLRGAVVPPALRLGSRGQGVRVLQRRLVELRYALPRIDGVYGLTTYQAVLAFQKVEGLPWTGRIDARTWRRLLSARPPRARYPDSQLEISKGRQVLFVVEKGRVTLVVHVSTGATGNMPLGRWRIYRKVTGWDWVLWHPMYFLRGFAVHGYPDVPAYPASHGCVRVPMWVAPRLFRRHTTGQSVYIYP